MAKERLNGYWVSKKYPNMTLYVERVYKAGYVTGFGYLKSEEGELISKEKMSHEELKNDYVRKGY
ncbi:hypothetical protein [Priestia megaterium]|uniref:hypothetical protein n=1 Tax=Priestia megaterium TaxID=1404 RepID=UPI00211C948D|nr:hypothetical protein [Priestia megaterium]